MQCCKECKQNNCIHFISQQMNDVTPLQPHIFPKWMLSPLVSVSHADCRYFEGGVSSVYLWDLDHGFAGVILIKKAGDGSKKIRGCWDSIHVIEVQVRETGTHCFIEAVCCY